MQYMTAISYAQTLWSNSLHGIL